MSNAKKLFVRLSIAIIAVWVLISVSTLVYEVINIKKYVKQKALDASKNIGHRYSQMNRSAYNMRNGFQSSILQGTNFHLFSITDNNGKTITNESSKEFDSIQQQIQKYKHELNIHNDNHAQITVMHDHDNNIYYLDVVMPWKISKDNVGVLHTFYEATHHIDSIYNEWLKTVLESLVVMFLFFIAGFPTVLYLQRDIMNKNKALAKTNIDILNLLGGAIAKRDSDTHSHNFRVTLYAVLLGESIRLSKSELKSLIKGAFLHDVGKIGISDTILLKPDKLTDDEFEIMKQHVHLGEEIIINSEQLNDAKDVVLYHHEKYDGGGYLHGLQGEEIPLNARIFAIADVFDALTSKRPYKEPFSYEKAKQIMLDDSGTHFDPKLLTIFYDVVFELYNHIKLLDNEAELKVLLNEKVLKYF